MSKSGRNVLKEKFKRKSEQLFEDTFAESCSILYHTNRLLYFQFFI